MKKNNLIKLSHYSRKDGTTVTSTNRQKKFRPKFVVKSSMAAMILASSFAGTGFSIQQNNNGHFEVSQSQGNIADAAEMASSVNLADMANPALENAKIVNFDSLGADPTGQRDSSAAWEKLLKMSETEPIHAVFTPGANYLLDIDHNIEVFNSKGIFFDGQGAKLLPKNTKPDPTDPASATLYETYVGSIFLAKGANAGFKMDNLNIDGSRNPNNLFFTFMQDKLSGYDTSGIAISGLRKTRLMRGFHVVNAEKLDVSNTKFENLFAGYTFLLENYRKVNINNLTLDKVGGDGQTDSLGMGLYFAGHTFDDTVININNFKMIGNLGNGPQSNPWTGYSNPGDSSYTSWIGIVIENGSIQSTRPENWLVDKNTTLNVTNSQIDNVEHTFHVESMAGNVAVNMNNVSSRAKAFGISAGIKGKYEFTGNKVNLELWPYGRNGLYATVFSSEFGDDPRYHDGYNANLTDASGGDPMHTSLLANSKITFIPGEISKVDKNFGQSYATVDYGNMVNGNFSCTQFDNLPNKLFANGGGYMKDVVINLADINPNEATFAGIKGDPSAAGKYVTTDNVVVNDSGAWTNLSTTCAAPTFVNFSGQEAPTLDNAVTPAPIGGGGTTTPTTEAPTTEAPTTEVPTTEAPTTETPTTELVTTEIPTEEPTTEAPTTEAPTTEKPTTEAPTTEKPTTEAPTTEKPTTEAPTTEKPTTEAPTTEVNPDGTYSIKGSVFHDKDYSGLFNAENESKIKEFEVIVRDATGKEVGKTKTDVNGNYSLDGLEPGKYSVSFIAPTLEYSPSIANIDLNKSEDKDSDGPTDVLVEITNENILNVDQGYTSVPANANLTVPGEVVSTEEPTTETPTTEKPTTEAPTTEEPTTEAPTTEEPTTEAPTTEKPTTEAPTTEKPTTEKPTTEKPTTEAPTTEAPTTEAPTTEKPTTEKPTTEKPTTEKPTTEKPTTEKPTTEKPTTEKPTTEKPTTEAPTTEKPTTEKPTTEKPTTEKPTTEAPTTEEATTGVTISGIAFSDVDYNGIYNAKIDKLLAGVPVELFDNNGKKVGETKTDEKGAYKFEGLEEGKYVLSFKAPLDYAPSIANINGDKDDDKDSDGPTNIIIDTKDDNIDNVSQGYKVPTTSNDKIKEVSPSPKKMPSKKSLPTTGGKISIFDKIAQLFS